MRSFNNVLTTFHSAGTADRPSHFREVATSRYSSKCHLSRKSALTVSESRNVAHESLISVPRIAADEYHDNSDHYDPPWDRYNDHYIRTASRRQLQDIVYEQEAEIEKMKIESNS